MRNVIASVLTAGLTALSASVATAQDIGVVASIDPNLRGTPPGQATRTLNVGNDIFLDETIVSNQSGRGQLLFNDQTTLTIAPSSTVVLDTFIYDPARDRGQIGINLTRGALRFIGGKTSKRQEAIIRTPSATIGVRGSSVLVQHVNGQTIAVFLMGDRMCYGAGGGRTCTSRQGGVVGAQGFMGVIDQQSLAGFLSQIDGTPPQALQRGGQTGTRRVATVAGGSVAGGVTPNSAPTSTNGAPQQSAILSQQQGQGSGQGLGIFPDPLGDGRISTGGTPLPGTGNGGVGNGGVGNGGGNGGVGNGGDDDDDDDDDDNGGSRGGLGGGGNGLGTCAPGNCAGGRGNGGRRGDNS